MFHFLDNFPGTICYTLINDGIVSQLVYMAIRVSSLKQLSFFLGKAQGTRTLAVEEDLLCRRRICGVTMWMEKWQFKFKRSFIKQPEVLLALTTFTLLLHVVWVCLKFRCPFKNGGLESSSSWSFIPSLLWHGCVTSSLLHPQDLAAVLWASRSRPPASGDSPVRERKDF